MHRKIRVSRFRLFMLSSSLSSITALVHIKLVWCASDITESNAERTPCLTPLEHISPTSFFQHLIKALADFVRPHIWKEENRNLFSRGSRWLSGTISLIQIYSKFTQWLLHDDQQCWFPTVSCRPYNRSFFLSKMGEIDINKQYWSALIL